MQEKRTKRDDGPTPEEKASPAILGASQLIMARGWVRGALCTERGYCITGALIAIGADAEVRDIAFHFIRLECCSNVVSQWNDRVAQSKKEVVKMLERAAKRARESLLSVERKAIPERGSIYSRECLNG